MPSIRPCRSLRRFTEATLSLALMLLAVATVGFSAPPAAAGEASADPTERTIHVPKDWEGAYEFGYAPVVRVGEMVIVSGIPAGGPGTYEEKIRRMYERARDLLAEAGATLEDVVELTTFHTEAKDSATFRAEFELYMPIHKEFFKDHRPAWTAVGTTALLSPGAPVEMRVIAVAGSSKSSRVVWGDPARAPKPEPAPESENGTGNGESHPE